MYFLYSIIKWVVNSTPNRIFSIFEIVLAALLLCSFVVCLAYRHKLKLYERIIWLFYCLNIFKNKQYFSYSKLKTIPHNVCKLIFFTSKNNELDNFINSIYQHKTTFNLFLVALKKKTVLCVRNKTPDQQWISIKI